ncbi:MAG TPA: phosphodiester glycosidase family protein [Anaerolineales bacterium]
MLKPISHLLHLFLLTVLIGSSTTIVYYLNNEPVVMPVETIVPVSTPVSTPTLAPTPVPPVPAAMETSPDPNWSVVRPGLEKRVIEIYNGQNQQVETLHIWRLDQDYFRMDIAFDGRPKTLEAWQAETGAALVVNGGYYSIENERYFPDGLTISGGETVQRGVNRFEGLLAIDRDRAEVRWLDEQPYNSSEPLQAALQSFPILVEPGGGLGFPASRGSQARARRTVIAQDREGRILFMIAPQGHFTLHELSVYLTASGLDLDIALNLDGGGSTGIFMVEPRDSIPPTRPLPFVILVYPR